MPNSRHFAQCGLKNSGLSTDTLGYLQLPTMGIQRYLGLQIDLKGGGCPDAGFMRGPRFKFLSISSPGTVSCALCGDKNWRAVSPEPLSWQSPGRRRGCPRTRPSGAWRAGASGRRQKQKLCQGHPSVSGPGGSLTQRSCRWAGARWGYCRFVISCPLIFVSPVEDSLSMLWFWLDDALLILSPCSMMLPCCYLFVR